MFLVPRDLESVVVGEAAAAAASIALGISSALFMFVVSSRFSIQE